MMDTVCCHAFNKDYSELVRLFKDVDAITRVSDKNIFGDLKELYDKKSKGELQTKLVNGRSDGTCFNECLVSLGDKVVMPEVKNFYSYLAQNHPRSMKKYGGIEDSIHILKLDDTCNYKDIFIGEPPLIYSNIRYSYALHRCIVNGLVDEGLTGVFNDLLFACIRISPVPVNAIVINTMRKMKKLDDFLNLGSEVYIGWSQVGVNFNNTTFMNLDCVDSEDSVLYNCVSILI